MNHQHSKPINKLGSYIGMGIMIVLFIVGLIIFSYILIWGAIIGLVWFIIAKIKSTFFPSKSRKIKIEHKGRTFEHED